MTGLVAIEPRLLWVTGTGFSENLVLVMFTITVWAIVKSLDKPWFIVLAGAAAGLSYITRSGMGALFVGGGLGGLAWRV